MPDNSGKHGGIHIDRYTPGGQNVGHYRPDGTPLEHKGKFPQPIPKSDLGKFFKAVKTLGKYGGLVLIVLDELSSPAEAGMTPEEEMAALNNFKASQMQPSSSCK